MDHARFDGLVRNFAMFGSRREALRILGGGAIATVFAVLGLEGAAAACVPAGKKCGRETTCCRGTRCAGGRCKCLKGTPCAGKCCPPGLTCQVGKCVCVPNCTGKECGDDGCGGTCGACREDMVCKEGTCVCDPWSDAFVCRNHQCGTVRNNCGQDINCGTCSGGKTCDNGVCKCPAGKIDCNGVCRECCNNDHCGAGTCDANGDCRWNPIEQELPGRTRFNQDMWIDPRATLFTNGLLIVEHHSENNEWCCSALRPRILVVVFDTKGRAIWVSDTFGGDATCCPLTDITCPHEVNRQYQQQFPAHPELGQVIGKHAAGLRIYISNGPNPRTFADQWITNIKTATDLAKPIMELAALFL